MLDIRHIANGSASPLSVHPLIGTHSLCWTATIWAGGIITQCLEAHWRTQLIECRAQSSTCNVNGVAVEPAAYSRTTARASRSVVMYLVSASSNLNDINITIFKHSLWQSTASVPAGSRLNWNSTPPIHHLLASVARWNCSSVFAPLMTLLEIAFLICSNDFCCAVSHSNLPVSTSLVLTDFFLESPASSTWTSSMYAFFMINACSARPGMKICRKGGRLNPWYLWGNVGKAVANSLSK